MSALKLSASSLVCEDRVELTGDITIGILNIYEVNRLLYVNFYNLGARTLVHPNVKIIARAGPIIIGENNLIEEQTTIINKYFDKA